MDQAASPIIILGIESSCDETAASICVDGQIRSNIIASQADHARYGGVIPELASRIHVEQIVPVVEQALAEAQVNLQDVDAVAFTQSPGLIGSLLVGAQFAKGIALARHKPLIAVHHMQAHVLANLIPEDKPAFPFLCLTVSGGHTQIVICRSPYDMEVIGETRDDAAGEAFDKLAKLLGLPYPGGPLIDKHAANGDPKRFKFPEPKIEGLDFSFSGLKTSVLYFLQNAGTALVYKEQFTATPEERTQFIAANLDDICASVQHRIVTILLNKLEQAATQTGIRHVALAGGVSANKGLRAALIERGNRLGWKTFIPPMAYCTDNAAMIAITGYYQYLQQGFVGLDTPVMARSSWT